MNTAISNRIRLIVTFTWLGLLLSCSGYSQVSNAEEAFKYFDEKYGPDPQLHNGKKYFREHQKALGHPYYGREQPYDGSITIVGKEYNAVKLKYEINKQYFVLEYTDYIGALQMLILNSKQIDTVKINNQTFIQNSYSEIKAPFIQQVYRGNISAFITYYKELEFKNVGPHIGYEYLKQNRTLYLAESNKVYKIRSKRSFLKIFASAYQKPLKGYISDQNIKIRKIDDTQFKSLVIYCNQIVE